MEKQTMPTNKESNTVTRKSATYVESPTVDPLTDHLTILLVPAALIGVLLVTTDHTPYFTILRSISYIVLLLLAIGFGIQKKYSWPIVATSAGIATYIAHVIFELYRLIQTGKLLLIFSTIVQPLFAAILMSVATGFIYLLVLLVLQYTQRKNNT